MRNNYSRYLAFLLHENDSPRQLKLLKASKDKKSQVKIPPEFNPKDWLSFLIHVDAELEHGLMVQYLYAAYSLGGDQVAECDRELVKCWREIVLGIAKEEMGHFISVQNVLRVIGAPLNFNRQDFPWDSTLYPFEFNLEPFTLSSLAKYVFAESPVGWLKITPHDDAEMKEIKQEIKSYISEAEHGDPVGKLFEQILTIINDPKLINNDVFLPKTYPYQAKFDEWGRGYAGGARGNSTKANVRGAPDVLVVPLSSRTDAISALEQIAEQGESTSPEDNERSHFERFLGIYKQWRKMPDGFQPSRNVAFNPMVPDESYDPTESPSEGLQTDLQIDVIENPLAQRWANLFNVRYRMLLTFLMHSFLLDNGFNKSGATSPRGTIIHASFGEMYNIRSISNVLVNTPIKIGSNKMAGPPFLTPYTMDLPVSEISRWRVHQDLLQASCYLIDELLEISDESDRKYLYSLREADEKLNDLAETIIASAG